MKKLWAYVSLLLPVFLAMLLQQCILLNPIAQAEKVGIKMSYSFSGVGSVNYVQDQRIDQEIRVKNQDIKVVIDQKTDFNVFELSESGNSVNLAVKLNSLQFGIDAGGQQMKSDLKDLTGREFQFMITDQGREFSMEETDQIVFEIIPSEKSNLTSIFKGIFPDVTAGILKKGASWNTSDTISFVEEQNSSELIMNHSHLLEGFAETDGYNCAVIRDNFTGTIKVNSTKQGTKIVTVANVVGTSRWYFAFDKGIFVKETSSGSADGTVSTPEEEMRLLRKFNIVTKLVH